MQRIGAAERRRRAVVIGPDHSGEDMLRLIQDRAAFLKHFGDSAAINHDFAPDARAFSGLADACEEVQELGTREP